MQSVLASSSPKSLIRKAFIMNINEGSEADYFRRHNPIWPELEATLRDHGAHNYSIFLVASTRQLFAYVEIESEERWAAIAETDVCKRWWTYMAALMPSNLDGSPVSLSATEVFHLS